MQCPDKNVKQRLPGPYYFGQPGGYQPPPPGVPYNLLEWVDEQLSARPGKFSFSLEHNTAAQLQSPWERVITGLEHMRTAHDAVGNGAVIVCALHAAHSARDINGSSADFRKVFNYCQYYNQGKKFVQ